MAFVWVITEQCSSRSGDACTTVSAATLVPASGAVFDDELLAESILDSHWLISLAVMSDEVPAGKPTMMCTGRARIGISHLRSATRLAAPAAPAARCKNFRRGSFMSLPHELEYLPRVAEGFRTEVELISDCSPAGGTTAAFGFTERRHVPPAALCRYSTPIPWDACKGAMSPIGP